MQYYRFKTFTTSYYFPKLSKEKEYMYGLYSSYGGKLSKLYWQLFKKYSFVRSLTSINEKKLPFPYPTIKKCLGDDLLLAFNMGSPGVEQKISILGYDYKKKVPFFAKFSQKEIAKRLTKNEINIYTILKGTKLTPNLLSYQITENYVCMKAEYIKGERPKEKDINSEIVQLCILLKNFHLSGSIRGNNSLETCLSHGDFCPWNILVSDKEMRLIDWELAKDRPLGYDLFTYICQIAILFKPESNLLQVIDNNIKFIKEYFDYCGIKNYIPYLKAFAKEKSDYELKKGNIQSYNKYHKLEIDL